MKTFTASIVFSILFLAASNLHGQGDTLTIRQIFDLKVGDTLMYTGVEEIDPNEHNSYTYQLINEGRWGFAIKSKVISGDSITYQYIDMVDGTVHNLYVWHIDSNLLINQIFCFYDYCGIAWTPYAGVNVSYDNRYSGVGICDTNSSDPCGLKAGQYTNVNNWIYNANVYNGFENNTSANFIQNIGLFKTNGWAVDYWGAYSGCGDCSGGLTIQLIYYHSDSIIWMDTTDYILSSVNEISPTQSNFKISPNPSTGEFYLETMNANLDNSGVIKIYDLQSRLVYQDKLQTTNHMQLINLPNTSAGLYLTTVENPTQGVIWRGRLVKL